MLVYWNIIFLVKLSIKVFDKCKILKFIYLYDIFIILFIDKFIYDNYFSLFVNFEFL